MYKCVNKIFQGRKKMFKTEKKKNPPEMFTLPFIVLGWNDEADDFTPGRGEQGVVFVWVLGTRGGKVRWWEGVCW